MASQRDLSAPSHDGMPALGLGTWQNDDPAQCAESVETALETGYRHIDTAQIYRNESAVGDGIERADVDREEIFLATKVWIDKLAHEDVIHSTKQSMDRLGVDRLDLLYVHWPAGEYEPRETLGAFEELYDRGWIDRIGVSNFEPRHLEAAGSAVDAPIFANQVEIHPLLQQTEVREYCADADIELVAYSPLARGDVFGIDTLEEIADAHGTTAAAVSLAWLREKGITAIPKATSVDHIEDNWGSLGVELRAADIEAIDAIDRTTRQVDPDFGPSEW